MSNLRKGWIKYCPVCGKPPIMKFDSVETGEWLCSCSDPDCDCQAFIVYDENADPESIATMEDAMEYDDEESIG